MDGAQFKSQLPMDTPPVRRAGKRSKEPNYDYNQIKMRLLPERRSSLCSRTVVESIRTGRIYFLKETLAMLGKKARTDELDEYGFGLLHHAARSDSRETLRILLEHGSNIEIRDLEDGLTPLHVAARFVGSQS